MFGVFLEGICGAILGEIPEGIIVAIFEKARGRTLEGVSEEIYFRA